ncbi:MAG: NAD(P)-dependent alcohol dehydrogenase [Candidatus Eremiobacteraeota bacterium]|nr:NAD(P)-dependent alcohol dehydrogenase [Candidatus Eremiobacteraeota bacterium]
MRAVRLHEIGGPQNLRIDEVPVPQPAAGEVLVRVRAAAFNHRDVFITQGKYPGIALPRILGSDGAGDITALGDSVTSVALGDDVVIDPMLDWGDDPHVWDAKNSSLLGMPRDGTFAQYVAVPAKNVYPKPKALSWEEAAAIPLAGLTAYRATFTRGALKAGETVLITGVGGGVQTFVLLFAKHTGARAIVTSGSDEKLARAKALGADEAINYKTDPNWHKQLRAVGPIDLAVDSSGGDSLAKVLDAVRPGGRVAIYGGTNGDATIKPFSIFWKHLTILGTSMGSPQDFRAMLEFFNETDLVPAIDEVFPIDRAVAAAERMASSSQFGKIVLRIP